MALTAMAVEQIPQIISLWCTSDLLMTFSSVLPQGQILHRYILLLIQSRDSHLAPAGTSSPGA